MSPDPYLDRPDPVNTAGRPQWSRIEDVLVVGDEETIALVAEPMDEAAVAVFGLANVLDIEGTTVTVDL